MLQRGVERCGSVSPVCRNVLTIISVKILHKCDETPLTVTHIVVSLMQVRSGPYKGLLFWVVKIDFVFDYPMTDLKEARLHTRSKFFVTFL